jgi:hypothetical protein
MTGASCPSCGGELVNGRRERVSPATVAAGWGGLAVSATAIVGSLIMIFAGIERLRATFVQELSAPQLEVMRVAGVPETVIRKVAAAEAVAAAEREQLTGRQQRLVADAQGRVEMARSAAAEAVASARINSIVVAVVGAVVGALSLLLVRRSARRCADCGAPAS